MTFCFNSTGLMSESTTSGGGRSSSVTNPPPTEVKEGETSTPQSSAAIDTPQTSRASAPIPKPVNTKMSKAFTTSARRWV